MGTLEELLTSKEWRITWSDNEEFWPKESIVTISRNGENKLDLHWEDSKKHPLSLVGVPIVDGRADGLAEARGQAPFLEDVRERLWHVTLGTPSPGKLVVKVEESPSQAGAQRSLHHLVAVWGADAGG